MPLLKLYQQGSRATEREPSVGCETKGLWRSREVQPWAVFRSPWDQSWCSFIGYKLWISLKSLGLLNVVSFRLGGEWAGDEEVWLCWQKTCWPPRPGDHPAVGKRTSTCGGGDGWVGKVLALQAWGSESRSQDHIKLSFSVACPCNPSTGEVAAGASLGVAGQPS